MERVVVPLEHVVFASPHYIERRGRPRTLKDLRRHDIVFNSHRPIAAEWRFRVSGRDRAVRFVPKLMVSEIEGVLFAVRAGRGIGRALSYQVADDLASGTLVRLLREFEAPARPVHLVIPSARHMPPTVRTFLDHAARGLHALSVIHDESQ
jgi:DNA-binding transcriptional LysR family regulator